MRAVTNVAPGEYIHLWASLPCTAGSPWQHLHKKYPSALKKIEENMDIFSKLIVNFEKVAREVVEQGGDVSFEWPTGCALWKHELTQNLINGLSMNKVNMHGCAAGLKSYVQGRHTDQETMECGIHFPGHHRHAEQVSMPAKRATSCPLPL